MDHSAAENRKGILNAKSSPFGVFLLLWILCLVIAIPVIMARFFSYLEGYEENYHEASNEVIIDEMRSVFLSRDPRAVYEMLTVKPNPGFYETEEDMIEYMSSFLENGAMDIEQELTGTDDARRSFVITCGEKEIARAEYVKGEDWNLDKLEFYAVPTERVQITAPEDVKIFINGKEMSYITRTYTYSDNTAQRFFEGYTTIPTVESFVIDGFCLVPEITALSAEGTELDVEETEEGIYLVKYPHDTPERELMEALAIEAVSAYASFISRDLPYEKFKEYFTKDNIYLYYINHTDLQWFTRHLASEIHSAEVKNFIMYNDEAFYCEVEVEQYLTMAWGPREPEVIITDGKFYFVRENGKWKVLAIEF